VTGHGYTPRTEEAHVYDNYDNLVKIPVSPKRMAVWLNDLKTNQGRFETTFYDKKLWSRPSYDPYMNRLNTQSESLEGIRKAHGSYYYQLGQIHKYGTHTANLHIIKDIGLKYGWKSMYYPGQYSSYDDMVNQLNVWKSQLGYDYDSLEALNYK
jgi:hypothetical protein